MSKIPSSAIICDIGSGTVSISLVSFNSPEYKNKTTALYTKTQEFPFTMESSGEQIISSMEKALKENLEAFISSNVKGKKTKDVRIFFSEPWYVSSTRKIKVEKESAFVITQEIIDTAIKTEVDIFKKEKDVANPEGSSELTLIDSSVMTYTANGYNVRNLIGKKVNSFGLSVFMTIAPSQIIKKIESAVLNLLHDRNIFFSTHSLAIFSALRDMYTEYADFMYIHIDKEMTEIFIVNGDSLTSTASIPFGTNEITRRISKKTNTSMSSAASTLSLYEEKNLKQENGNLIDEIIKDFLIEYESQFTNVFSIFSETSKIPSHIYISCTQSQKTFCEFLTKSKSIRSYNSSPEYILLIEKDVEAFFGLNTNSMFDIDTAFESVFLSKTIYN